MFLAYSVTRRELGYYCLKDLKDGLLVKEWIDSKILIIPLSSFNNDIETIVVKENENKNKELSVFKKAILTGTCILVFGSSLFFNPKPVKSVGLPSVVSNRLSETEINQLSEMAKNGIGRPQIAFNIEAQVKELGLTEGEIEQFNIVYSQFKTNVITIDEVILELRAGGFGEWVILILTLYMFHLNSNTVEAWSPFMPFNFPTIWGAPPPSQTGMNQPQTQSTALVPIQPTGSSENANFENTNSKAQSQIDGFVKYDTIDLKAAYNEMQRRASNIDNKDWQGCSFQRFKELSTEDGTITFGSTCEAISGLQGEMLGYYRNLARQNYGKGVKGLDFTAEGIGDYKHITHVEGKNSVGKAIKKAQNQSTSISKQGKSIAKKLIYQKDFWSNSEKRSKIDNLDPNAFFPEEQNNILSLVDNFDVPMEEKTPMETAIKKWSNNDSNLVFINNEENI